MDLSHPIESIIPSGHWPVLAVLAGTEAPLTGRQVAGLAEGRLSARRVADVLRELVATGLVIMSHAGSANQYRLNRDHLAAPAVVALADLRSALLRAIADMVQTWSVRPTAVWLYGSVSRGDAGPGSDVDLCVIRPDAVDEDEPHWAAQVERLRERIVAWSGNQAEVLEYDEAGIARLAAAGDPMVDSLRADGRALFGPAPAQLLADDEGGRR